MRYLFQTQMSQSCNRTLSCDQCRRGQNGTTSECCGCFSRFRHQQSQNSATFVTDYAGTRNINNGKNTMTNMSIEEENNGKGNKNLKMIPIDEQPPEITTASTKADKILFNEADNGQDKMEMLEKYNNKIIINNENIIKKCCNNNKKTSNNNNNDNPPVGHNLQPECNSNLFLEQNSSSYSSCSKCSTNSMSQTEQPEMEQNLPNEIVPAPLSSSLSSELQMECNSNQPESISTEQFKTIPEFRLSSQANTEDLAIDSSNKNSTEKKCRQNKTTTTTTSTPTSTSTLYTKTNSIV